MVHGAKIGHVRALPGVIVQGVNRGISLLGKAREEMLLCHYRDT